MRPFRFRLQTLLKLRLSDRDQRQVQYAEAQRAEHLLQEQLAGISQEIAQLEDDARALAGPGVVSLDQLIESNRYELMLRSRRKLVQQQLLQLGQELQRRRELLMEADRQVRILEKLRERQLAGYEQKRWHLEGKELDEMGQRIARAKGSES